MFQLKADEKWSLDQIRKNQLDAAATLLLQKKHSKPKPTWQEIASKGLMFKALQPQWDSYSFARLAEKDIGECQSKGDKEAVGTSQSVFHVRKMERLVLIWESIDFGQSWGNVWSKTLLDLFLRQTFLLLQTTLVNGLRCLLIQIKKRKVLVKNVFTRFGVPLELHYDQIRNFESKLFQRFCDLLGIRKTRTTLLHPQWDGTIKKFNKTIQQHL